MHREEKGRSISTRSEQGANEHEKGTEWAHDEVRITDEIVRSSIAETLFPETISAMPASIPHQTQQTCRAAIGLNVWKIQPVFGTSCRTKDPESIRRRQCVEPFLAVLSVKPQTRLVHDNARPALAEHQSSPERYPSAAGTVSRPSNASEKARFIHQFGANLRTAHQLVRLGKTRERSGERTRHNNDLNQRFHDEYLQSDSVLLERRPDRAAHDPQSD